MLSFKQKTKQSRTTTRAIMLVERGLQQAKWSHLASTWVKTGRKTPSLYYHCHYHHQADGQGAQDGGGPLQPGEPWSGREHRHGHREVLLRLRRPIHGHGHLPCQDWGPGCPGWVLSAHKHWVRAWVFMMWFQVTKRNKRRSLLRTIKYNWSFRFVLMAGVAPRGRRIKNFIATVSTKISLPTSEMRSVQALNNFKKIFLLPMST